MRIWGLPLLKAVAEEGEVGQEALLQVGHVEDGDVGLHHLGGPRGERPSQPNRSLLEGPGTAGRLPLLPLNDVIGEIKDVMVRFWLDGGRKGSDDVSAEEGALSPATPETGG
jgi:hypothetical protein